MHYSAMQPIIGHTSHDNMLSLRAARNTWQECQNNSTTRYHESLSGMLEVEQVLQQKVITRISHQPSIVNHQPAIP